jgi:hypothetical protein
MEGRLRLRDDLGEVSFVRNLGVFHLISSCNIATQNDDESMKRYLHAVSVSDAELTNATRLYKG